MDLDCAGLERLSRDECLRLLSTTRLGRIGFSAKALPVILPVAYAVDDGSIVVRVGTGSQLDGATRDAVVAFESDDVDPCRGTAWSVTVTGVASDIIDDAELETVRALGLGNWAAGTSARFVRISLDLISGRRASLGLGPGLSATG